ncbi:MAG: CPBP family intramembrane metalloprotease [Asgard group archaeon]|nr:CPBP family intramembrane metalloprotease [Asgard group archaeon]
MGSTKKKKRTTKKEEGSTWLSEHPWLGILILLFLYIIFLIVPTFIYRIFVNPAFFVSHLYLYYIIDFFGVAFLFLVIVPLVLGIPNKRGYVDHFQSIRVTNFKPPYRTIVLGLIAAIVTLVCMLIATLLAALVGGDMIFEPSLMIDPLYPATIYSTLKPGIWEEVAFRGIILVLLLRKYSKKTSIIVNGILFGTFHVVNILVGILNAWIFEIEPEPSLNGFLIIEGFRVLYTTFFGIFLAYLFIKTNSLIPCIITHYLVDAFASQVTIMTYDSEMVIWIHLIFMTVIGFGMLPMKLNTLIVRASCYAWPQPYDEQVKFFDTYFARKKHKS